MGRSTNNTGRSINSAKHVRLYEWLLRSEAYRSLSVYSRALLVEVSRCYNGTNNGYIGLSVRQAALSLNCSDKPIRKAFAELQEKGFLKIKTKGGFNRKISHSTEWILTQHEYDGKLATKEFMRWKSAHVDSSKTSSKIDAKKKTRCTERRPTVVREAKQNPKNSQISLHGGTRVHRNDTFDPNRGVPTYHTYSLPYTPPTETEPAPEGSPTPNATPDKAVVNEIRLSPKTQKIETKPTIDLASSIPVANFIQPQMTKLFGLVQKEKAIH